jgi:RNA polymerase sigma factor (TIGR02999 family)
MNPSPGYTTQLLRAWSQGDRAALDQLMPLVYDELRRLAHHYLRQQRPEHTLQATVLVHEAYLRLVDQKIMNWQNRAHFFGIAANIMRSILVDYARRKHAAKRGGGKPTLVLDDAVGVSRESEVDLVALDEALIGLSAIDPRQGRIVELRFFGGLRVEEVAEVLGVSPITVKREWRTAKAWLHRELRTEGSA